MVGFVGLPGACLELFSCKPKNCKFSLAYCKDILGLLRAIYREAKLWKNMKLDYH